MFCEKCGEKLNGGDKFCIHCGETVSVKQVPPDTHTPPTQISSSTPFPVAKYLLAVFAVGMISFVGYMLLNNGSYDTSLDSYSSDEEEYVTALNELGPLMEPVGYFDDISLFDSDINIDEWFSHIQYLDVEQTPVTDENRTFASVVKIVCEDDDYIYYGSGTNVDPSGYILTNHHVVEDLPEDACMVGFPDPKTGLIREAYWTTIITDKADETGHDLAYLAIERPIFDEDGNLYGYYDKVANGSFPYFEHTDECLATATQLGEELRILGYPPLSGGSLTVTNGLVSSLYSQDGYIVTSAKIVSGNSGGLAVDSNGCYVGVPTAVYYDDEDVNQELFGEIIDAEFVFDFDLAIEDDLEEFYERTGRVDTSENDLYDLEYKQGQVPTSFTDDSEARSVSNFHIRRMLELMSIEDPTDAEIQDFVDTTQLATTAAQAATEINPNEVKNWLVLQSVYEILSQLGIEGADDELDAISQTIQYLSN